MSERYFWIAIFLLGCYHGVNPAMGWLFAVALGLQERSVAAVLRAAVQLVLGHVVSVAIVIVIASVAAAEFPHVVVHATAAAILIVFGAYRLIRARHVRWVGMRVGFWGLASWGFLMSSAHGAGLMLMPFVTASPAFMQHAMPMPSQSPSHSHYALGLFVLAVHTLGYVVALATVALVVYAKIGVSFLRSAWFNLDLVWGVALVVTGLVALFT